MACASAMQAMLRMAWQDMTWHETRRLFIAKAMSESNKQHDSSKQHDRQGLTVTTHGSSTRLHEEHIFDV